MVHASPMNRCADISVLECRPYPPIPQTPESTVDRPTHFHCPAQSYFHYSIFISRTIHRSLSLLPIRDDGAGQFTSRGQIVLAPKRSRLETEEGAKGRSFVASQRASETHIAEGHLHYVPLESRRGGGRLFAQLQPGN